MPKTKVLIFYTAVGQGHKSIAENIGFYFAQLGFEVKLENILEVEAGWFVKFNERLYTFVIDKLPWVWNFLYQTPLLHVLRGLRLPLAALKHPARALNLIQSFNPDIIITTQTVASAAAALIKKRKQYQKLFGIAFSDFHMHKFWLYDQADFYLVNIAEQKTQMMALGIDGSKIFICGMTLKPKPPADQFEIKDRLRIDRGVKVILMASGSMGTGINANSLVFLAKGVLNELTQKQAKGQIIIVCGKNKQLYEELKSFRLPNVIIFPFYQTMPELYAIADIFITKPGGLSVAESLSYELPILITHWLPGQEDLNIEYLTKRNLIMPVASRRINPAWVIRAAVEELLTAQFRKQLQKNSNLVEVIDTKEAGRRVKFAINQIITSQFDKS
ncbi:MAG: hypothetical protein A3B10_03005 [Candidatus Doudnabacteria bacterium RIFCSPLOWO2_01_FULL_44_21]|uniref:Diacylglycerol glucosyltransferase N-terminal domain-containing protein n=1 Tax=Candidatus Doudnabacteria bacterium RIFCSPLOWO2_01_FULL_44_21 TaxID=1817841 RepID=A0A1F5Q228_9BACT|nr:MAG: hypothetical protein A3B95_03270 [Candidatus Doudnabacteria bacterium RIFCSPHIGHO2_02_FULL_43_13b]OGE96255.1 MAG: hypothetical protein A3B10_03005 [Candidatus Doudnabacteria bacterium RIFCSPLOWO2_01_FULL_44_21]